MRATPIGARDWVGESRYVFQLSARLVHWTIFFAAIVLSVTGYWIGTGNMPAEPGEAPRQEVLLQEIRDILASKPARPA